jgi:hypothetical protein
MRLKRIGRFCYIKKFKIRKEPPIMAEKAKRRTLDEQLDLALKEREQKDQRIKDLMARKRTKEDKARTNRLCKRGGLVEKLHPRLAALTDEEFSLFVDAVIKSDYFKGALDKIMPPEHEETESGKPTEQGGDTSAEKTVEAAAQPSPPIADKPSQTPQNGGAGGNAQNGNRPPQNNNNNVHRPANNQHGNNIGGNGNGGNGTPRTS